MSLKVLPNNIGSQKFFTLSLLDLIVFFSDPDSDASSDVSDLFGDPSSDEYQPNFEDLSDSDQELYAAANKHKKNLFQNDIVVPDSDDEPYTLSIDRQGNQEVGEQALNNANQDNSSDDEVGPSDEDEGLQGALQVNNPNHPEEQPAGPPAPSKKRKKSFSPKLKVSRIRPRNPNDWKRRKSAIAREKGQVYTNYKGQIVPAKSFVTGYLCSEKCRLKCNDNFTLDDRQLLFSKFYKLDVNTKNAILFGSMNISPVQRPRKEATKHKSATFKYVVTFQGKQTFVCKKAFASLYQVGNKKIDLLQKSMKTGSCAPSPDKRGRHASRPHRTADEVTEYVKKHISMFPADESHYSRSSNIHKKYLSPLLSVPKMHSLYLEQCIKDNVPDYFRVTKSTYRNIFVSKFNLSFGHPKSDTCSTCDAGNSNEEHVEMYHASFELLKADREKSKTGDTAYLTMDLQQTMPLPRLSTSKAFYLRQLWFYNLGIHVVTKDAERTTFCVWTENQASRGSKEVTSSLLTALEHEESLRNIDHLVIWSDSCSGQNKNFLMVCLYQYLIYKGLFKVIDHKFPEVGHTYLDSDRDFGRIEKNLRKHQNVYSPEEYRQIIAKSSKKNQVLDMKDHFRDMEDLPTKMKLYNRKVDVVKNKLKFRDNVKWIRVTEYGSYLYKPCYDEYTPFMKVDISKSRKETPRLEVPVDIPRLLRPFESLKKEKVENLKEQLKFVPEHHRWWYQQIIDGY